VEFAQELGSEADLDTMLAKAGERFDRDAFVSHLAFFLREEGVVSPTGDPIFPGCAPRWAATHGWPPTQPRIWT